MPKLPDNVNATIAKSPLPLCHLCGGDLIEFPGYSLLGQATSDCKPWRGQILLAAYQSCGAVQKALTSQWHEEVAHIYESYSVYAQAQGGEQLSFNAETGANSSRSQSIVHWLKQQTHLPENGVLLDIGCGNGCFLDAFQRTFPQWQMIGAELDDRNRALVESIPGVLSLHTGPLTDLKQSFDLIVMVHALEHIPKPIEFLSGLKSLIKPTGLLLIEVPDLDTSPFDVLIADHCTHFSERLLPWVVESAGFQVITLSSRCVAKELSLLAGVHSHKREHKRITKSVWNDGRRAEQHLNWLQQLLEQARGTEGDIGIFGTSISATWLAQALGRRVKLFVDEDTNRIGNMHLGLPIQSLPDAPATLPILMPIRRDIALAIQSRIGATSNLIPPPHNLSEEQS